MTTFPYGRVLELIFCPGNTLTYYLTYFFFYCYVLSGFEQRRVTIQLGQREH